MTLVPDTTNFQTPKPVCQFIIDFLNIWDKSITILEPTPGAGQFVSALRDAGFYDIDYPKGDFFNFRFSERSYDLIIGNPPFSPMSLGYDITDRCFQHLPDHGSLVFILPWFFLINSDGRAEKYFPHLEAIIHLPRRTFPGASVQTACFILNKQKSLESPVITMYSEKPKLSLEEFI